MCRICGRALRFRVRTNGENGGSSIASLFSFAMYVIDQVALSVAHECPDDTSQRAAMSSRRSDAFRDVAFREEDGRADRGQQSSRRRQTVMIPFFPSINIPRTKRQS